VRIIEDIAILNAQIKSWKKSHKTIGLVPTMGFFHDGHLALMKEAQRKTDRTVVTVFVNPRQFGPQEDLDKYPRDISRDTALAKAAGVDLLFCPSADAVYPAGYQTTVSVLQLSQGLCGASRPGHFDGVATILVKLFNLVQPDIAVFGEKDYQQLALIRQLVMDLNFPIDIIGHPIVREADGLAMSSRNKYLEGEERANAVCLYTALQHAVKCIRQKEQVATEDLIADLKIILHEKEGCKVDYISIVHPQTLKKKTIAEKGDIVALAVFINNKIRLIDNITL
jgi:pantoate--beta-alanine ligase